jgi:RPA family protein
VETAERTVERIEAFDPETSEYAAMAEEQYDLPVETYRDQAIAALESLDDGEMPDAGAEPAD